MREKKQRKPSRQNTVKNKQHTRKNFREETTELIDENFVFGYHAVIEALKEGRGNKLFMAEDARGEKIDGLKEAARAQSVPVKWVPKQKLDQMSNQGVHQSVILAITPYEYLSLDELLAQTKEQSFYLILDNLEDPHNFGSILRTADASGVDGIIIPKHRAVGITSCSREDFYWCCRTYSDCSCHQFKPSDSTTKTSWFLDFWNGYERN